MDPTSDIELTIDGLGTGGDGVGRPGRQSGAAVVGLGGQRRHRTEGTVEPTGKTKEILGRKCEMIKVETWIESEGTRFNQRDERVWVTADLPIDWEAYDKINRNTMKLLNFDESLGFRLCKE